MAGVSDVLAEDQFLCCICLDVFTDPVTAPCGHSFCNVCINQHWDKTELYHCPLCKEEFSSRPKMKTNTFMSQMVSQFKNKPQTENTERSESEVAEEGDVLCDVCPDPKLKALKSCLVCQTSYCPKHLTPHDAVPRLKKHQLIAPVENLEERICPQHERLLDMFCREDSQLICVQCKYSDHEHHCTVALKERCEEEQSDLQQKIQERREKIQELQRCVELSQENADREMKEGVHFFNDLMKRVQQSLDQFKENIEKKHQEIKEKAEEFMKEVEAEISALEQRRAQMEEIWSSDDHFHFVQTFTLDEPAPELNDWTEASVRAPSYEGRAAVAVSELMNVVLNPKCDDFFQNELRRAKEHAVDVTLDPDTAHPYLEVSENKKQVHKLDKQKSLPNNPERFSFFLFVLGKEKFSSGRFYYEVEVKGKTHWWLGVASESADRKEGSGNKVTPQNGFWQANKTSDCRGAWAVVEKVGVFVDYDEGLMCFFNAESSTLFYSCTDCAFTGNILPLFSPGNNSKKNNSAPFVLTPVRV